MDNIVKDVLAECQRQVELWGVQHRYSLYESNISFLDQSRACFNELANKYKKLNDESELEEHLADWAGIALEELYEALAESDINDVRKELVQTAAVIFSWLQDIDNGTVKSVET